MALKAIIFDIDGVLADSREAVVQNTGELLKMHGFSVPLERIEKMSSAHSAETVLVALVPSLGKDAALCERMLADLSEITAKNLHMVKPTPLAKKIGALAGRYLLAAASNRKTSARMVLGKIGVEEFFGVVVTSADAPPKPDPGMVRLALARLGVEAGESVFVGDNPEDEAAGKAAGVRTFLVDGMDEKACWKLLGDIGAK